MLHYSGGIDLYRTLYLLQLLSLEQLESGLSLVKMDFILGGLYVRDSHLCCMFLWCIYLQLYICVGFCL